MSPVGSNFRKRLVSYPSLVNNCTLVYFNQWPKEALSSVARSFLEVRRQPTKFPSTFAYIPLLRYDIYYLQDEDIGYSEAIKESVYDICVTIHTSVTHLSESFGKEQMRYNYITPSSYLELLRLFVKLFKEKRDQLNQQRVKFTLGVRKLVSTKESVVDMQIQLSRLKPYLEKTAADTKRLMDEVYR